MDMAYLKLSKSKSALPSKLVGVVKMELNGMRQKVPEEIDLLSNMDLEQMTETQNLKTKVDIGISVRLHALSVETKDTMQQIVKNPPTFKSEGRRRVDFSGKGR